MHKGSVPEGQLCKSVDYECLSEDVLEKRRTGIVARYMSLNQFQCRACQVADVPDSMPSSWHSSQKFVKTHLHCPTFFNYMLHFLRRVQSSLLVSPHSQGQKVHLESVGRAAFCGCEHALQHDTAKRLTFNVAVIWRG